MGSERIYVDDPRKPDVRVLLERHLTLALSTTPRGRHAAAASGGPC